MKKTLLFGIVLICLGIVSGCATGSSQNQDRNPEKITLQDAMNDVAEGLNKMYVTRAKYPKAGLIASEVTIVFNVSASKSTDQGVQLTLAPPPPIPLKGDVHVDSKTAFSRGNTITIKFINYLLAPKDSFLTIKSPDDVDKVKKIIQGNELIQIENQKP